MKPRTRLFALLALAAGLWWARDRLLPQDDLLARPSAAARKPGRVAPPPEELCATPAELPQRELLSLPARRDPFTGEDARAAAAAPVARAPARPVVEAPPPPAVVVAAPPPPPPAAPRLPYRFIGQVSERSGSASVFLALGANLITARPGETIDGGFRLDAIAPRELTFTHLATRSTVRMAIEGESP